MKSLRKTLVLAGTLLLAVGMANLAAQSPQQGSAPAPKDQTPQAPPAQAPPKIGVVSNLVIVPVIVKDKQGALVPDLRKEDFRIFEDSIEQRISTFSAEGFPLSMVVLIDNDLKSKVTDQVRESLLSLVAGMSTNDEAMVCRFDTFFYPGKGFTKDQDQLLTELKRLDVDSRTSLAPPSAAINEGPTINGHSAIGDAPNVQGTTMVIQGQPTKALDDAVYAAAQLLKDRDPERQRRKLIFLISDGVNAYKFNTNKYDTVVKDLLRFNVAVYGVGVGSAFYNRRFERLAKYAKDTGGDVYYAERSQAMSELYSRVTEEARNQYTLYYSPAGTDRGAEYHTIEVRVKREGLTLLTREGYFSGAPR